MNTIIYRNCMTSKVHVSTAVGKEYKTAFHKRCIENNTTMSKVLVDAMKEFMDSHPEKPSRFQGVT
jgi:hypothetical protein